VKRLVLLLLLLCTSRLHATSYFMATTGSDGNTGLNNTTQAWAGPNHALNCGDTITASAGTYATYIFTSGFGTVTCSAGNNVAWVQCATFDACKISPTTGDGMDINASYWGISGFEVDGNSASGVCFFILSASGASTHHIIVANNVAVGCGGGGISSSPNGVFSEDYIAIVGNIIHGAAGGSSFCGSGISIYEPVKHDSLPGTHIYIAGNESDSNFNPNPCGGTVPTDGDGLILDTFDGSQSSGNIPPYTPQVVAENNLLLGNGGRGLLVYENSSGTAPFSHIFMRYNTIWGNNRDTNQAAIAYKCGEAVVSTATNTELYNSIAVGAQSTGCNSGTETLYAVSVYAADGSSHVYQTVGYAASGTTSLVTSSTGFSLGPNNLFGTNPVFANAAIPGTPSCGSSASAVACMTTVIANFTPTASSALGYGYQSPSSTSVYNPFFPQWLCGANLPSGLVTMGCLTGSTNSGASLSGATLH
jgi:hypothetical protein